MRATHSRGGFVGILSLLPRRATAAAASFAAVPSLCLAEPGGAGYFNFSPGEIFVFGIVVGSPSALGCVLAETVRPRRPLPIWLTAMSAIAAVAAIALALSVAVAPKPELLSARLRESGFSVWLIVPPLAVLALRGIVVDARLRLGAGWVFAIAVIAAIARQPLPMVLLGGAAACLSAWSVAVLVLQKRGISPAPRPETRANQFLRAQASTVADALDAAGDRVLTRLKPAELGLRWWFGGALVLYLGIAVMVAQGRPDSAWIVIEWQQLTELLALRPLRNYQVAHLWWVVGLPWSLLAAGAIWGLAGTFGAFDAGRARIVRLAAIVFGGALLAWTALVIVESAEVRAREEQAAGLRR